MANLRRLEQETFGERLHRAYRRGRELHGFTYEERAEALRQVIDISDQSLIRYETLEEVPARPGQRQKLYLILIAYGFDPEDFGLTEDLAGIPEVWDMKKIRRILDPAYKGNRSGKTGCSTDHKRGMARAA